MTLVRVCLGILWLLLVVAFHEAAHELTRYRPAAPPPLDDAIYPVTRVGGPRVDLYGNEILEAVGDYRVDLQGEIYERHAPDTAVLRLSPPGT